MFGLADETWGQIVAAVVVPAPHARRADDSAARAQGLIEQLTGRLAPHKRPRRLGFLAELPQTPAGKLDRAALAAQPPPLHTLHHRH